MLKSPRAPGFTKPAALNCYQVANYLLKDFLKLSVSLAWTLTSPPCDSPQETT